MKKKPIRDYNKKLKHIETDKEFIMLEEKLLEEHDKDRYRRK